MTDLISPGDLTALRRIGDPDLDGKVAASPDRSLRTAAQAGKLFAGGQAGPDLLLPDVPKPSVSPEGQKLLHAQRLFVKHGNEIGGALLLAALPQSCAGAVGCRRARRLVGAAQRLPPADHRHRPVPPAGDPRAATEEEACKMWTPGYQPGGELDPPWKACHVLRTYHARIRHELDQRAHTEPRVKELLGDHNEPPLNQEDLLAMLLTFTVSVFEVIERCGVAWSTDEQEAYLHLWDVIGAHLGIGTPAVTAKLSTDLQARMQAEGWVGLRPPTVAAARRLLDQLRRRLWWRDGNGLRTPGLRRPGQVLTHALLAEMAHAMPPRMRSVPQLAVRKLAPPVVRDALLLGGGGLVSSLAEILPGLPIVEDHYAPPRYTNPVDARVARLMVNEVTRHVVVHFLRTGRLALPGLEDWSDGLVENGGGDQPRRPQRVVHG